MPGERVFQELEKNNHIILCKCLTLNEPSCFGIDNWADFAYKVRFGGNGVEIKIQVVACCHWSVLLAVGLRLCAVCPTSSTACSRSTTHGGHPDDNQQCSFFAWSEFHKHPGETGISMAETISGSTQRISVIY
jgi:hypothetical protein